MSQKTKQNELRLVRRRQGHARGRGRVCRGPGERARALQHRLGRLPDPDGAQQLRRAALARRLAEERGRARARARREGGGADRGRGEGRPARAPVRPERPRGARRRARRPALSARAWCLRGVCVCL